MKKFFTALCVLGFVLLLGTAGAFENGAITWKATVLQSLLGMSMFLGSYLAICRHEREVARRRARRARVHSNPVIVLEQYRAAA